MDGIERDITKLKYVLYARKSSTDETRQVRSIPDQIKECMVLANRLGINVVDTIEETQSAKKPNQRPKFNQMMKDIKSDKYDAILAWNPDRLARNMLEAGSLIDMVDTDTIKDLKFVTHHFTRDANGKMLLGMSFVLSKQYSDDLSQKVTRGVRNRFQEGKTSVPKHGYLNEGGIYRPDNEDSSRNFDLICQAWEMRVEGVALEEISDYMNNSGYGRLVKKSGNKVKMDPRILSDIFKDPIYYGVLMQANQTVDLRAIYDFKPAVSEEDYKRVQELSYRRIKPSAPHKIEFYPFRLMIHCSFCNNSMRVGPSSGSNKQNVYLYFRCDTKGCKRKKKSIRSKMLVDFLYQFLEKGLNLTEDDYNDYYGELTEIADEKRQKFKIEVHSREGALKQIEAEITERALGIVKLAEGSTTKRINEERITELEGNKLNLIQEINKLRQQLTNPEDDRLSIEQFLNLSKNAGVIVQSGNAWVKDQIARLIFLNFTLDEEKVLSYQLKPHFEEMIKLHQQRTSRGPGN